MNFHQGSSCYLCCCRHDVHHLSCCCDDDPVCPNCFLLPYLCLWVLSYPLILHLHRCLWYGLFLSFYGLRILMVPFLVKKHYQYVHLISEKCRPYLLKKTNCLRNCISDFREGPSFESKNCLNNRIDLYSKGG